MSVNVKISGVLNYDWFSAMSDEERNSFFSADIERVLNGQILGHGAERKHFYNKKDLYYVTAMYDIMRHTYEIAGHVEVQATYKFDEGTEIISVK